MATTTRKMLAIVAASAAVTFLMLQFVSDARAQAATSLAFDVGNASGCTAIGEGDEIEVRFLIANVTELQQWEATIVYDRDVLEIVEQDTHQFLTTNPNSNTIDASEPLPDYNGRHFLGITDASAASESGSGVLAIITFKGVGEGTSSIGIPQFDFNGDGHTDEGVTLEQYGGKPIGDVNGDRFFDGSVEPGYVAVSEDCSAVQTISPTEAPTPLASQTSTGGGTNTESPSGSEDASPPASGGPSDSGGPSASVANGSPTSTGSSPSVNSPSASSTGTTQPGNDNGGNGDGGSSFPVWLIAVLLAGGLAAGGAVVAFAMRRPSDTRP